MRTKANSFTSSPTSSKPEPGIMSLFNVGLFHMAGKPRLLLTVALGVAAVIAVLLLSTGCSFAGDAGSEAPEGTTTAAAGGIYEDPSGLAEDTVVAAYESDIIFFDDHASESLVYYYDTVYDLGEFLVDRLKQLGVPRGTFTVDYVEGPEENYSDSDSSYYNVYGTDADGAQARWRVAIEDEDGAIKTCSLLLTDDDGNGLRVLGDSASAC